MNKRGLSVIVGTVLLILISVVAIGILWAGYNKFSNESFESDGFDCSLVSVKPVSCVFVPVGTVLPNVGTTISENTVFAIIKREIGNGELTSVKMVLTDISGGVTIVNPENFNSDNLNVDDDFSDFEEFTTKKIINVGDVLQAPVKFNVVAVVGKDKICEPSYESISCGT